MKCKLGNMIMNINQIKQTINGIIVHVIIVSCKSVIVFKVHYFTLTKGLYPLIRLHFLTLIGHQPPFLLIRWLHSVVVSVHNNNNNFIKVSIYSSWAQVPY